MMANFWQQMPFVRLIIPFIAGIVFQLFFNVTPAIPLLLLLFSGIGTWLAFKKINNYTHLWWPGLLLNFLLFFFGTALTGIQNDHSEKNYLITSSDKYYLVKINEPLLVGKNSYKAQGLVLEAIDSLGHSIPVKINVLLYFKKDTILLKLRYGDILLIKSHLQEISSPMNPGEFNFKSYLAYKHINLQTFLSENNFIKLRQNNANPLFDISYKSQTFIKHTLQQYVNGKQEMGVGEALLFGFDDDIDPAIFKSYSRTGTLHVLAVSGMHVGLIFMVLSWLLKPVQKIKRLRYLQPVIVLTGVWLYSVLCGLSPSILRATVMISFLVTGELIKRRSNPFNSLAVSAFMLLVFDTSMIANVGFQLSYAAVLGIIAFYQIIYEWLDPTTRLGDAIWKVIAVSLAAQVLTFPMSLYYFHQFPNYFLLANLLIIPITTLVIYTGILLLIFSKIYIVAYYIGISMQGFIYVSNNIAHLIEQLPFSYTDRISISVLIMILIYGAILCMIQYFRKRDLIFLKISLFIIFLVVSMRTEAFYDHFNQKKLIVHCIKHHVAVQIVNGNESTLFADSGFIADKPARDYHIQGFLCEHDISYQKEKKLGNQNTVIEYTSNKFLLILSHKCMHKKAKIEYVLIQGKDYHNLEEILNNNNIKNLLLNADLPLKKKNALKKIAAIHHIPCYDISENGAFEVLL